MKLLFSSQSAPEVGLLKSLLEDNGIPAEVRNESVHSNFPGAAFQPEIWILNDEDYVRACEVRDAWYQPSSVPSALSAEAAESRPALWFVCAVCFGGGIVLAWHGFRAKSWVPFVGVVFLFGVAAIVYNLLRHLPSGRRSRNPRTS
jgi:hypothetical protein